MKFLFRQRSVLTGLLIGGLGIVLLAGLVWYGVTSYFLNQSDRYASVSEEADHFSLEFMRAREAEHEFLLQDARDAEFFQTGDSPNIVRFRSLMESSRAPLQKISTESDGRMEELLNQVRALLKEYEDDFSALAAALRQKSGLTRELHSILTKMEEHVRESGSSAAEAALLRIETNLFSYLLEGDAGNLDANRAALKSLETEVSRMANAMHLQDDLKRYEGFLNDFLALEQKIGKTDDEGLNGALNKAAREIESILGTIVTQAEREDQGAREKLVASHLITLIAGLAIAGLFFYFFAKSIVKPIKQLGRGAEAVGQGNLNTRIEVDSSDELGALARSFNGMVAALSGLVNQVQKSGINVNSAVTEIAATAKQQQATASEIAATTTEIGATSKEISATSKELVRTMNEVSTVAEHSATLAGEGNAGLSRMEETMRQLMEASNSISGKLAVLNEKAGNINQMVTTITKVADQTNLLSLNAAIEAEKAGEYGRGFAVVATEIRRLADQTAVATYDIELMVKEIQSAVSAGVMGMDKFSEEVRRGMHEVHQVGGQLGQIIQQVQALAPRFEAVNEGMHAQATGAEQISQALAQLSEAVQQTVESLRQSGLAIEGLNQVAGDLRNGVSRFRFHD